MCTVRGQGTAYIRKHNSAKDATKTLSGISASRDWVAGRATVMPPGATLNPPLTAFKKRLAGKTKS